MDPKERRTPPPFCQYANGPCDQQFDGIPSAEGIFLYPNHPTQIADAIEAAAEDLRTLSSATKWLTWRDFQTGGTVIFCTICKHIRFSRKIFADVTTLNFNLLFEIGFAIGLGVPIIPIRDTTFLTDKRAFEELGLLDTLTYLDFCNSQGLSRAVSHLSTWEALPLPVTNLNRSAPLYIVKPPIDSQGAVTLKSLILRSGIRTRIYDVLETPRLSLHEVTKHILSSFAVLAHLLSPERQGALVHNARCALLAGLATATGKLVLLLQEGNQRQPIDYRDLVASYSKTVDITKLVEPFIAGVWERLQGAMPRLSRLPNNLLERLDIGDVIAENEIQGLRSYFVRTGQYIEAKRGHARLVIGPKGSGKTAIFYALLDSFGSSHSYLLLDIMPEGHQFQTFREAVLTKLSPGLQESVMVAFWYYLLLCELAERIVDTEYAWAQKDDSRRSAYDTLGEVYQAHAFGGPTDFSERLLKRLAAITERYQQIRTDLTPGELIAALFTGDIPELEEAITAYLKHKDEIWLLVDSLDKGWPVFGFREEDIVIVRALLEASRKLQNSLARKHVIFHIQVFLRRDIYDHLVLRTADKGKDTAITLDWNDAELFKKLIHRRIIATGELSGTFEEVWPHIFDLSVGGVDSFQYIMERSLMRPREFLRFLHQAIEVATNRGHGRVSGDDIKTAEARFSEDLLASVEGELRDIDPEVRNPLYPFLGSRERLSRDDVLKRLGEGGFRNPEKVLELLVWFGFLGVQRNGAESPRYAYELQHNVAKVLAPIESHQGWFVIQPGFRSALECPE